MGGEGSRLGITICFPSLHQFLFLLAASPPPKHTANERIACVLVVVLLAFEFLGIRETPLVCLRTSCAP